MSRIVIPIVMELVRRWLGKTEVRMADRARARRIAALDLRRSGAEPAGIRPPSPLLTLLLLVGISAPLARPAMGQAPAEAAPRVAVVLSGGGARGLAHIGVLQVLEDAGIRPEIVTGTSMGSLVGGLYALGYGPHEILSAAQELDWPSLFLEAIDRDQLLPDLRIAGDRELLYFPIRDGGIQLPTGIVEGARVTRLLHRLTWRSQAVDDFTLLPRAFATVATDVETGEAVVLSSGSLARAIRASIAVPAVFEPTEIEGRLLIDGGVARNLPAVDALRLGADLLICSDVSERLEDAGDLRSLMDVLIQTISFQIEASSAEQRALCDVVIRPETEGLSGAAFDLVDEWTRRGAEAARATLDASPPGLSRAVQHASAGREGPGGAAASGQPGASTRPDRGLPAPAELLPDSVWVRRVVLRGVDERGRTAVRRSLELPDSGWVSATTLDRALGRLHATGLVGQLYYRLEGGTDDRVLVVDVEERPRDRLGIGIHYDNHYDASLLFAATLHRPVTFGSSLHVDLNLGEQVEAGLRLVGARGTSSPFVRASEIRYVRGRLPLRPAPDEAAEIAEVDVTTLAGSAFVGLMLGRGTLIGLNVEAERASVLSDDAPDDPRLRTFYAIGAALWHDSRNRASYPTRGWSLMMRSDWADEAIGSGIDFGHHLLDAEIVLPLARRWVARLHGTAAALEGAAYPAHRLFFLGGAVRSPVFAQNQHPLWGLQAQERYGRGLHLARAILQHEVRDRAFLTVGIDVGNAFPEWTWNGADYQVGYGASMGARSPLGPLEVILSGPWGETPTLTFSLGHRF